MPSPDVSNPRKLLLYNIGTLIGATWPEVPVKQIYREVSIERRDWVNMTTVQPPATAPELVPPWVVVTWAETPTPDWGSSPKEQVQPTIYYVAPQEAADAAGVLLQDYIDTKLRLLQAAVFADPNCGTVLNEVAFDTEASNPINVALLENKENLLGGSVMFTIIIPLYF